MYKRTLRGFTLIELLVVISIIGFLSTVVLASLNTARARARDAKRISDIRQLQAALELYKNTNGSYPPCTAPNVVSNGICGDAGGVDMTTAYIKFSGALAPLVPNNISSIPKDLLNIPYLSYEYMTKDTVTPWYIVCDGKVASTYEYVISFRTEKTTLNLPKFLSGERGGYKEYCVFPQ